MDLCSFSCVPPFGVRRFMCAPALKPSPPPPPPQKFTKRFWRLPWLQWPGVANQRPPILRRTHKAPPPPPPHGVFSCVPPSAVGF